MKTEAPAPAYLEPTARGRLSFVLAWLVYMGWVVSHYWWLPGVVARLDSCNPCASLGTMQFLLAYIVLVTCLPVALFGRQAWRTYRSGQHPPPGSWVLFRKRVYGGAWAKFNAAGLALVAIAFAAVPVLLLGELGGWTIFFDHGC